jgi:hypothetical protein
MVVYLNDVFHIMKIIKKVLVIPVQAVEALRVARS